MAVKVRHQGRDVEVSDKEAQELALSGAAALPKGPVTISKAGRVRRIDSADLPNFVANGWALTDEARADRIKMRRQESDAAGQALGIGEGVARGLSLGLSDPALVALGADPERMQVRSESPLAATGEVLGAVGGAVLSGGSGTAAQVAGRTGAGMAARAGRAVTRRIVSTTPTTSRRVVGEVAGQAVEGSFFGAGTMISEDTLGDRQLSAERILGGAALGSIIGGSTGLAFPAVSAAFHGGRNVTKRGIRKVLGRANTSAGDPPPEIVDDMFAAAKDTADAGPLAKTYAAFTTTSDEAVAGSANIARRGPKSRAQWLELAQNTQKHTEDFARELQKHTNDVGEGVGSFIKSTAGEQKYSTSAMQTIDDVLPDEIADAVGNLPVAGPARHKASERIIQGGRAMASGQELVDGASRRVNDMILDNSTKGFSKYEVGPLDKAQRRLQRVRAEFAERSTPRRLHEALTTYKRDLGAIIDDMGGWGELPPGPRTSLTGTIEELKAMYREVQENLRNPKVWGDEAASFQARQDDALTALMTAQKKAQQVLGRAFGRADGVIDGNLALRIIKNSTKVKGEAAEESLAGWYDAAENYIRVTGELVEQTPEQLARSKQALDAIATSRELMRKRGKEAQILDWVQSLEHGERSSKVAQAGMFGGAFVGHAVGGIPGAMVGGAAGFVLRPLTLMKTVVGLWNLADRAKLRGGAAMGRLAARLKKGEGPRKRSREEMNAGGVAAWLATPELLMERVGTLASQPDKAAAEIEDHLKEMVEVAPGIAGHIANTSHTAIMFLSAHMPRAYTTPLSSRPPKYDAVEIARWMKLAETVLDPYSAWDAVADGHFTPDQAKALRSVWPSLYDELQMHVFDMVAEALAEKKRLPPDIRNSAGTIFGIQADVSFQPKVGSTIQGALANVNVLPPPKTSGKKPPSTAPVKTLASMRAYDTPARHLERQR